LELLIKSVESGLSDIAFYKGDVIVKNKDAGKLEQEQKQSWFKRFLKRLAKGNQRSGDQSCAS